jgi:hypothetical protein
MHALHRTVWRRADDAELVAGLLQKNALAWRELFRRYDRAICRCVKRRIRKFNTALCTRHRIEKIVMRVETFLRRDQMQALRNFDCRRGSLATWIERMAEQAVLLHLEDLTRVRPSATEE